MAPLGFFVLWAGYTLGIFGFSKIKSAYGQSPSLSLSDLALPSHRSTFMAAASAWTGASTPPGTSSLVPTTPPVKLGNPNTSTPGASIGIGGVTVPNTLYTGK